MSIVIFLRVAVPELFNIYIPKLLWAFSLLNVIPSRIAAKKDPVESLRSE